MHAPHDNEPSKLQLLVLLLKSSNATVSEHLGFPVTVHVAPAVFSRIDALSQHSGQTRNKVITELIDVALAELEKELSDDDRYAIDLLQLEFSRVVTPSE